MYHFGNRLIILGASFVGFSEALAQFANEAVNLAKSVTNLLGVSYDGDDFHLEISVIEKAKKIGQVIEEEVAQGYTSIKNAQAARIRLASRLGVATVRFQDSLEAAIERAECSAAPQ